MGTGPGVTLVRAPYSVQLDVATVNYQMLYLTAVCWDCNFASVKKLTGLPTCIILRGYVVSY